MKRRLDDLPQWELDIEEVSAGVFRVVGRDRVGHSIGFTGVDPDALVEQCRSAIARLRDATPEKPSAGD